MKHNSQRSAASAVPDQRAAARKGSTIVVVIALLLALTFLGIVGYTIGVQEQGNAEYFSEASKNYDFTLSRDDLFDWGLRQVILGTRLDERQSALHGGHLSLMATMLGQDMHPYSGAGTNLYMDGAGEIVVDQNHDRMDDNPAPEDNLIEINRAPFARFNIADATAVDMSNYPEPDVDYTYWDVNNPFMAYVNGAHQVGPALGNTRPVVLPSYHRPQYLRSLQRSDGVLPADWYRDPRSERRVLRPHRENRAVAANGTVTNTLRYMDAADPDLGMISSGPFPFDSFQGAANGIWDGIWSGGDVGPITYEYDADPDNDGVNEAIWLDLGFPMQTRDNPDGTVTNFVPMWGITIYDADALFNLNAHGNSSGVDSPRTIYNDNGTPADPSDDITNPAVQAFISAATGPNSYFGRQQIGVNAAPNNFDTRFISRSNQGVNVSEINPQWGMFANTADGPLDQHHRFLEAYGRDTVAEPLTDNVPNNQLGVPTDEIELANLEWWWLMTGRLELDAGLTVSNLFPGRYGEVGQLNAAFSARNNPIDYPGPGLTYRNTPDPDFYGSADLPTDDNGTAEIGSRFREANSYSFYGNPFYNVNYRVFPSDVFFDAWQTPLDLRGRGRPTESMSNGRDRLLEAPPMTPHRYPSFAFYQQNLNIGRRFNDLLGNAPTPNNAMLPNYLERFDVDEPEEMVLVPSQAPVNVDGVFGAAENTTLHLAETDQTALGLNGRLKALAPINFGGTGAEDRRKAFTTVSWDLKSFSRARTGQTDARFREWEFEVDVNRDGTFDPTAGDRFEFPPSFGTTYLRATFDPMNPTEGQDPFRRVIRDLLRVEPGNVGRFMQRRLSVNQICDYDRNGRIRFRPLTPHPQNLPPERLSFNGSDPNFTTQPTRPEDIATDRSDPNNPMPYPLAVRRANQEYLARRDRQQLCRDIYVLLYTFGSRNPPPPAMPPPTPQNVTNTPWTTLFPAQPLMDDGNGKNGVPRELLEMAQFAVNMVDRMDADDVITKFEFDIDLSDGWNLNDDAFDESANGMSSSSEPASTRFVVYGIEAQQLTLSEAQVVYAKHTDDNSQHPATQWTDGNSHHFTFVELENVSPRNVDFTNESWQIAVEPDEKADPMDPMNPLVPAVERRLTLRSTAPQVGVGTNSRLVIGTASAEDPTGGAHPDPSSHVLVDPNFDPMNPPDPSDETTYTRVVPRVSLRTGSPNTSVMDLIRVARSAYRVNDEQTGLYGDGNTIPNSITDPPAGIQWLSINTMADQIEEADDRTYEITFRLRRRLNPHRTTPPTNNDAVDNPWVVVDTITIQIDVFKLDDSGATMDDIREQLTGYRPADPRMTPHPGQFRSKERTEPLARGREAVPTDGEHNYDVSVNPDVVIRNSFGTANANATGQAVLAYELYQTHFDRDFASVGELLDVPLYGPGQLTQYLGNIRAANAMLMTPQNVTFNDLRLASDRFVGQGQSETTPPAPAAIVPEWQRLFAFVEVPDRSHQHYDEDAIDNNGIPRRPTFVNDVESRFFYRRPGKLQLNTMRHPQVLGGLLDDVEVIRPDAVLTDRVNGGRRWWAEFIRSRDGQDADPGTTNGFYLPGLPVAKPFREYGYSVADPASDDNREHTVLRARPGASPPSSGNRLFEVLNTSDPALRYRLLNKVLNHGGTRSNVFLIFMQVDFFEAVEVQDPTTQLNVVRVGGKLTDSPAYRGFFVVDRSKIFEVISEIRRQNPAFDPQQEFLPQSFHDPADPTSDPNDPSTWKYNYSFDQDFDFHQLILHRQTIN